MRRPGYTLMEMLVVLAILVIAAGITVPVIKSMLTDTRQNAAADQVRAQLAEARARAMDDGEPWMLAYMPGTGMYQLAPEESTEWSRPQNDVYTDEKVVRDNLPEGIIFGATEEAIASKGSGGGGGAGTWVTIAVYLPAGNAREDTKTYFGTSGFTPLMVSVRALTGVVDVSFLPEHP